MEGHIWEQRDGDRFATLAEHNMVADLFKATGNGQATADAQNIDQEVVQESGDDGDQDQDQDQ